MSIKNVVLLGGSGNIGAPILSALLASKLFTVTVLSRESSSATFPCGVRVIKTDYSLSSLVQAFKQANADAVVSTVTTTAVDQQTQMVDAAAEAGIKRFITSDFGSDISNPAVLEAVPILGGKAAVIDYLRTKEKDGLSWTSIITGAFLDFGLATGFLGFDIPNRKATLFDEADVPATLTTYATVAKSVVGVLSRPAETANRFVHVQSVVATQAEILAALEKATGATFAVERKQATDLRDSGLAALQAGGGPDVLNLLVWGLFGRGNGGDYGRTKDDNALLGLERETLDEVIKPRVA